MNKRRKAGGVWSWTAAAEGPCGAGKTAEMKEEDADLAAETLGLPLPSESGPKREAALTLYSQALRHRSAVAVRKSSNERLEFLGDAVLSVAVTEYLYRRFPSENEGFLSGLRSRLVRGTTLTAISRSMGIDRYVRTAAGGVPSDPACEDAFEALVAAVHLAAGYEAARDWVVNAFETHAVVSDLVRDHVSPKEELLRSARTLGIVPLVECVRVAGGGFKAVVRAAAGGEILGAAEGPDPKSASDAACASALRHIGGRPAARQKTSRLSSKKM